MLIRHIEGHMRRAKMSPSRFGREALSDPNFVTSLREGREPRRATVERVMAYIQAQDEAAALESSVPGPLSGPASAHIRSRACEDCDASGQSRAPPHSSIASRPITVESAEGQGACWP
jgi:hypothetical protein